MAIIIQNIDSHPRPTGRHLYQLRINQEVICNFYHNRELSLEACLKRAAEAAAKAEENKWMNIYKSYFRKEPTCESTQS